MALKVNDTPFLRIFTDAGHRRVKEQVFKLVKQGDFVLSWTGNSDI